MENYNVAAREFEREQRIDAMPRHMPAPSKPNGVERTMTGVTAIAEVAGIVALVGAGPVDWLALFCMASSD